MAWVRSCWVSSSAVAPGSRLRTLARWVRVLAFGTVARRESTCMGTGELAMSSDDGFVSGSAHKTVTGYTTQGGIRTSFDYFRLAV